MIGEVVGEKRHLESEEISSVSSCCSRVDGALAVNFYIISKGTIWCHVKMYLFRLSCAKCMAVNSSQTLLPRLQDSYRTL